MTTVTGVCSCDIGPGGVGNAAARSCRSKFPGQWRGRMEGNDSVKEVRRHANYPLRGFDNWIAGSKRKTARKGVEF